MSENPAPPPPLDDRALEAAIDDAVTAHINGRHPDLAGLRWMYIDGDLHGFYERYRDTSAEVAEIAAAWAQRLGLVQVDTRWAGEVEYAADIDGIGRVAIRATLDRAALLADLAARKAAREAGEQ